MSDKNSFQKDVLEKLRNSGFKDLLQENEHKEFIEMIAATYFSNQLDYAGMIEYLGDIVKEEDKRKQIADIVKNLHIESQKVEEKPQVQQTQPSKEKDVEKELKKKVKTENQSKPNKQGKHQKQPKKQTVNQGQHSQQDSQNIGEKKNLKHQLETTGKTKCRFFPFCKNPESCEFFHPTQKCQYFPNCRYGDNCLYIHESCRFKEKCTKMNCPYAHPGKRTSNNMMQLFMKSMMMGKNPAFGNNKMKKKRPTQQAAKQEQQSHQ